MSAVVHHNLKDSETEMEMSEQFARLAPVIEREGAGGSNELLVGRAGYVMGALWLRKQV